MLAIYSLSLCFLGKLILNLSSEVWNIMSEYPRAGGEPWEMHSLHLSCTSNVIGLCYCSNILSHFSQWGSSLTSLRTLPLSLLTCLSKSRSGDKNSTLSTGQVILSTPTCDLFFSLRGRAALPWEAPHSTTSPKQMRESSSGLPTPLQPPWKPGSIWHAFFYVSMSSPLAPSHQYLFNAHFQKEQKQNPSFNPISPSTQSPSILLLLVAKPLVTVGSIC